jgi:D-alanine-D-alanine ligase
MIKTVAVFFGGKSTEHDISIITAISSIIKPLELTREYKVIPVYITKDGRWFSDDKLKDISFYKSGDIDKFIANNQPLSIVFDDGLTLRKSGFKNKDIKIDIAFPSMHGMYGEDGSLMGLLRMAGIPFVGSDMTASAISMDKVLSKQIAELNGVPIAKYVHFVKSDFEHDLSKIVKKTMDSLSFPLFIKPAHLGSSIGITKATNENELRNAIEVAFYYDNKVVIEEAVNDLIEVTVPIIGNDELTTALVEKALFKIDDFFDFDTKYINNGSKKTGGKKQGGSQGYSELPAKLDGDLYDRALETAKKVYRAIGCEGISRIDLLIDSKTNTIYFNEINPMPGSLYAHNWRASGISSVELVSRLVKLAQERFDKNKKTETIFESSFLKQF